MSIKMWLNENKSMAKWTPLYLLPFSAVKIGPSPFCNTGNDLMFDLIRHTLFFLIDSITTAGDTTFMSSGTSNSNSLHRQTITILWRQERPSVSIYVLASEGTLLWLHHPMMLASFTKEASRSEWSELLPLLLDFMFNSGRITWKVKESMPSSLLPLLYTWLFPKPSLLSSVLEFTDKPETKRASRVEVDAAIISTGSGSDCVGGDRSINGGWSAMQWKQWCWAKSENGGGERETLGEGPPTPWCVMHLIL